MKRHLTHDEIMLRRLRSIFWRQYWIGYLLRWPYAILNSLRILRPQGSARFNKV
jgi:hypothetical protein